MTMQIRNDILKRLPLICFILAMLLFVLSMVSNTAGSDTDKAAKKVEGKIENRLEILEDYVAQALTTDHKKLLHIEDLPEDMVIYRYINDTLQSWCNQFSVLNDDISSRLVFQRLTSVKNRLVSPLAGAKGSYAYLNLGPKWYIIRSIQGKNNEKVIAGLEIKNTYLDDLHRTANGVNPRLKLPGRYSVLPLNSSGGSTVMIGDTPLFKVIYDSSQGVPFLAGSILRWIALCLFITAAIMFLARKRTLKNYCIVTASLTLMFIIAYIWAVQMNGASSLFSPSLYADGPFFFSLGALLLINTYIFLIHLCTYLIHRRFFDRIRGDRKVCRRRMAIYGIGTAISAICTFIYMNLTLKSLIMNSNISMELYRWNSNIPYTILVYISYITLLFSLLLHIQGLRPAVKEFTGLKYDIFRPHPLAAFAFIFAIYFTATSSILGFRKEQDRVMVWANRLAVDRDLGLEIQLRSVEESIAADQVISSISGSANTNGIILNRLAEYYFNRIQQEYNMNVLLFKENDTSGQAMFNDLIRTGTPIADGSRFLFLTDDNGHSRYAGVFLFYEPHAGLTRMILEIEPNSNREDRGYYSLMGQFSKPGEVNIPPFYSYARFIGKKLVNFKGTYPYPTILDHNARGYFKDKDRDFARINGYAHFINLVSGDEVIMISRPIRSIMVFFTSFSYLFLALTALLQLSAKRPHKKNPFKNNYFKTRINTILFTSAFLLLVSMATISVIFVYKRNEANMYNLMSSKISTAQALVEMRARQAHDWHDLNTQEFSAAMESIGNTTKSDLTLFTPGGKVFRSTTPEVFERMLLGSRINQEAFYNIKYLNQRYYIHREKFSGKNYWALYAPVFNNEGRMLAILSIPYTDKSYDFRREAFFHAALIFNLFLLLLIGSLLFSTREVNAMFSPLVEIGSKMNSTDIHNLEYIIYKRDDEISTLVDAYNRMVHDLAESTQKLAQAERDKAWSAMARQVAHEIKNPLTPIKLEIQRLIRLKERNNPVWEERFDSVAAVVLEHIDILTDTANEFSTFAKLYSEEPVELDLDKTLKDQLVIFNNKENIDIQYIGMEKAFVMAPKPQLIRVFVNLLTNAIQAVEMMQQEAEAAGEVPVKGRVMICLRNSTRDGYYDILFDDNGAGVQDENRDKLFTPNFTTKSSGTGLGLAICRNIIEKCDGTIRYQKSFTLGGASFVVTLPKLA